MIGEVLGHSPKTVTTEFYVPVRWDEMVSAVSRLEYGTGQLALFG